MAENRVSETPNCLKVSHVLIGKIGFDPNAGEKLRELAIQIGKARKELLDHVFDRIDEVMIAANPAQVAGEVSDLTLLHTEAYSLARTGLDQAAYALDTIRQALRLAESAHRRAVRARHE